MSFLLGEIQAKNHVLAEMTTPTFTQILSEIEHMQHNDFSELHICGEGTEVIYSF